MKKRSIKEKEISDFLKERTIKSASYYCLNKPGYLFPNAPEQLVDAGVELELDNGTFFSFGMNFNYIAIDCFFEPFDKVIKEFNEQFPFKKIELNDDVYWKNTIGKCVNEIRIVWNWFEDIDEIKHYIPQDLELILNDNAYLSFSATAYLFEEDGLSILEPDSEGEILVLFNEEDAEFFKRGKYYEGNNNLPDEFDNT